MFDLLKEDIIAGAPAGAHSLPGLLAAMARDEVRAFPALRPHQRAAWHMFLVQLAAQAMQRAGGDDLPTNEARWRDMLLALSEEDAGAWALIGPHDRPAFLQPPAPEGLKWKPVETPDALDMLITARNHDLKQRIARDAAPQDWVFALVSLQTSEGYGGAGNYGIARMNGGSSSRPLLGLAPVAAGMQTPDPSAWWRRDVARLAALRRSGDALAPGLPGGDALVWLKPWPEGESLDLTKLDPWFIEVCRRVRLERRAGGATTARMATSKGPRIDARAFRGVTGDPWTPVSTDDPPKSLTLGEGDFSYRRLSDLLYSGKWRLPPLAEPGPDETGDLLLVAEALSRGNSKTFGLKSRIIPVPGALRGMFQSETAGSVAKAQIEEIQVFDKALRDALALAAARGDHAAVGRAHYAATGAARASFDRAADALFFPALWRRLEAHRADDGAGEAEERARADFLRDLHDAARLELEAALPAVPCPAIHRPRAETRARRRFEAKLRRTDGFGPLFEREAADA